MQLEGFRVQLATGGRVVVLPDSKRFTAIVSDEALIDPAALLGADERQSISIQAIASEVPASIASQDTLTIDGQTYALTKNPTKLGPFLNLTAVKV